MLKDKIIADYSGWAMFGAGIAAAIAAALADSLWGWTAAWALLAGGLALLGVQGFLRYQERRRIILELASESQSFALNALQQAKDRGWLRQGLLQGASLCRANWEGANLSGAKLNRADLSQANLKEAVLVEASLAGATLAGANLAKTQLRWADLRGANLRWADLSGAQLDGAQLAGADLRFANLANASMGYVDVSQALMQQPLTEEQARLVIGSFNLLRPNLTAFAEAFYQQLFGRNPELKALFIGDPSVQCQKFAHMLSVLIETLHDRAKLIDILQSLARRHLAYGVKLGHYSQVGEALLEALRLQLGKQASAQAMQAWADLYGMIAVVMQDATRNA